jgi:hypothetical protein
MIASEMNRAGNWIRRGDALEVRKCYERAWELLYLTIATDTGHGKLRELSRMKEVVASFIVFGMPSLIYHSVTQRMLVMLSPESWNCMFPRKQLS